jgi:hypothetical protein
MILFDRLLVKFKVWDEARIAATIQECGGMLVYKLPEVRWVTVRINQAEASDMFIKYLHHPDVDDVTFSTSSSIV